MLSCCPDPQSDKRCFAESDRSSMPNFVASMASGQISSMLAKSEDYFHCDRSRRIPKKNRRLKSPSWMFNKRVIVCQMNGNAVSPSMHKNVKILIEIAFFSRSLSSFVSHWDTRFAFIRVFFKLFAAFWYLSISPTAMLLWLAVIPYWWQQRPWSSLLWMGFSLESVLNCFRC